jgi:uncharacterized membrane protein
MKSIVGVYESHDKAVVALQELKKSGYPDNLLSIVGKADLIDNHIHIKSSNTVEKAEASIGVVAGAILGILTGVGIFVIPGFGFLYGAGALIGAFAGVDVGLIAGGMTAIFTSAGIDEVNASKYEKHLNEGKFLVFADGDEAQLEQAHQTLHTHGQALELTSY